MHYHHAGCVLEMYHNEDEEKKRQREDEDVKKQPQLHQLYVCSNI